MHITIRADSGFCRWRLVRWCDSNGIGYVIGLARNSKLEGMAAELMDKAWRGFETTGEKQRHFETIHDAAATWDRPCRVIVKAEHTDKGPNQRFMVTNVPGDLDFGGTGGFGYRRFFRFQTPQAFMRESSGRPEMRR